MQHLPHILGIFHLADKMTRMYNVAEILGVASEESENKIKKN